MPLTMADGIRARCHFPLTAVAHLAILGYVQF